MRSLYVAVFAISSLVALGDAEPPKPTKRVIDISKNPYVLLYKARLRGTQAMVNRSSAEQKFEDARAERLRKLYERNAVSLEEYQEGVMRAAAARENIEMNRALVDEAEALLGVAELRVKDGQDMPVHTLPIYPR